ncbi:HEAT repeat domain-containing protein [Bremerella cremea]|nr:HEAT repeat domain-containing protein [Bremerella cremea]
MKKFIPICRETVPSPEEFKVRNMEKGQHRKRWVSGLAPLLFCLLFLLLSEVSGCAESREEKSKRVDALGERVRTGEDGVEALAELVRIAHSNDSFAASRATGVIGTLGELAAPAVSELVLLLGSEDGYVRREAALSLSRLGPTAAPALDRLAQEVRDASPGNDSTWFSAQTIGNIGGEGVKYLPLLRSKLGSGPSQFDDCLNAAIDQLEKELGDSDIGESKGEGGH